MVILYFQIHQNKWLIPLLSSPNFGISCAKKRFAHAANGATSLEILAPSGPLEHLISPTAHVVPMRSSITKTTSQSHESIVLPPGFHGHTVSKTPNVHGLLAENQTRLLAKSAFVWEKTSTLVLDFLMTSYLFSSSNKSISTRLNTTF